MLGATYCILYASCSLYFADGRLRDNLFMFRALLLISLVSLLVLFLLSLSSSPAAAAAVNCFVDTVPPETHQAEDGAALFPTCCLCR